MIKLWYNDYNNITLGTVEAGVATVTSSEPFVRIEFAKNTASYTSTLTKNESQGTKYYNTELVANFNKLEAEKKELDLSYNRMNDIPLFKGNRSDLERAIKNGIDIIRVFDALNDIRNMEKAIKVAKDQGAHVQGTISYTISPVHTLDDFVNLAKDLEALDCDSVAIKDMAGLITPSVVFELVSRLKEETDLLVDLHCHCTSGMTPISYYAACQAGVDILDTAISPLAWGTSQPPTESMVAALQGTEFDTGLDLKLLAHIKKYFEDIKEKYLGILDPISESIDADVLLYQIPGGMLSNLISQLKEQNALDRYNDVLEEMPRVRKDMGYPPLVTPTSQIVGIQSVMNVLGGERYKTVSNEVKEYMKGMYGKPPAPVDEKISKKIIGDEEVITCRPADLLEPEFDKYKSEKMSRVLPS